MQLANGSKILRADVFRNSRGDLQGYVMVQTQAGEFVTWGVMEMPELSPGLMSAYWGHYFGSNESMAREDYESRRASGITSRKG